MSEWMGRNRKRRPVDLAVLQESALATAQATLQNAINASGITRSQLAERMDRPRSFISKMMSGSHNLTIKTFALALAACGFEPQFAITPIQWGWTQSSPVIESTCEQAPTAGGQFNGDDPILRIAI